MFSSLANVITRCGLGSLGVGGAYSAGVRCRVARNSFDEVVPVSDLYFVKVKACGNRCRCITFSGVDGMVSCTFRVCGTGSRDFSGCRGFLSGRKDLIGRPAGPLFTKTMEHSSGVSFFSFRGGGVQRLGSLECRGPMCSAIAVGNLEHIGPSSSTVGNFLSLYNGRGCIFTLCSRRGRGGGPCCSRALLIFS